MRCVIITAFVVTLQSSFFLFVQSRLVLFHRFGSVVNTLGFQDTWLQYSMKDKCGLEVSCNENCSSCFLSYIKLFTLYLDKLKKASETHVTNPRPGQYLPTCLPAFRSWPGRGLLYVSDLLLSLSY